MALSPTDVAEINDLFMRYAWALDHGDIEAELLPLFTDDAVLESPISGSHAGVDGLRVFAARNLARREKVQSRHIITNLLVNGEGDRATVRAYLINYDTPRQSDDVSVPTPEFRFTGHYRCLVERRDGRWRISRREVHIDGR